MELNARVMSERDLVGVFVPIKKKVRGRIVLSERNSESQPTVYEYESSYCYRSVRKASIEFRLVRAFTWRPAAHSYGVAMAAPPITLFVCWCTKPDQSMISQPLSACSDPSY